MVGKRAVTKRRTFERIVAEAGGRFRAGGYEATAIESIARGAGVSAGTVYNYFGTKRAILLAVVTHEAQEALDAAEDLGHVSDDPVETLMPLVMTYVDAMTGLGPRALRELLTAGFDPDHSDVMAELISVDERSLGQIRAAIALLQERGALPRDIDPSASALLVFSIVAVAIFMFASDVSASDRDTESTIREQLALAVRGIGTPAY